MNRKEIDEIESFLKQLSEETDFEFELKLIKDWTELHMTNFMTIGGTAYEKEIQKKNKK